MIDVASAVVLACVVPLPLKAGQEAKDREIAMIRAPLPEAMIQSLRGPVPLSTQRFIGESGDRHEWIIAKPPGPNGTTKMLRLTPQGPGYYPYKVKFGDAKLTADGAWNFTFTAEGACRIEQATDQTRKSVQ
jgi:hypothetical protein